jgi:GT2 family glycosyltransferase
MRALNANQPSVCIIMIHSEGSNMLEECLKSLFGTNYQNLQVILLDNDSNDLSCEHAVELYGERISLIRSDVRLGYGAGNNLALKQARGDYIVLLNDDVLVEPNWLVELVKEAEKDPTIGACQPKLISLKDPRFFEYNGACGGMLDVYGVPLTRGRIFDLIEEDSGQYDKPVEVFWASGAALFLRGSIVREVGFLDETFSFQMEEIDWCWRLRLHGYKVLCVPKAVVRHLGGGTPVPEKFYLKQRNNLVTVMKNYSGFNLWRFIPLRAVQDVLSFAYYLTKKETRRIRALPVLRAYFWLLRNPRSVLSSRYMVQRQRKVEDKQVVDAMVRKSVSIQTYLLGRKYFSQLSGLPLKLRYYMSTNSDHTC